MVTAGPFRIATDHGIDALADADTDRRAGPQRRHAPTPARCADRAASAHAGGTRIASICSGAFTLAAAGLLDGKRATTHWIAAGSVPRQLPGRAPRPRRALRRRGPGADIGGRIGRPRPVPAHGAPRLRRGGRRRRRPTGGRAIAPQRWPGAVHPAKSSFAAKHIAERTELDDVLGVDRTRGASRPDVCATSRPAPPSASGPSTADFKPRRGRRRCNG